MLSFQLQTLLQKYFSHTSLLFTFRDSIIAYWKRFSSKALAAGASTSYPPPQLRLAQTHHGSPLQDQGHPKPCHLHGHSPRCYIKASFTLKQIYHSFAIMERQPGCSSFSVALRRDLGKDFSYLPSPEGPELSRDTWTKGMKVTAVGFYPLCRQGIRQGAICVVQMS